MKKLLNNKKNFIILGIVILIIIVVIVITSQGIKNGYDSLNNRYIISNGKEVIIDIITKGEKPKLAVISTNNEEIPYDITGDGTKYQLIMKNLSDDCLYQISLYGDTRFSDEDMQNVFSTFIGTKQAVSKQNSKKTDYFDNISAYEISDSHYYYYINDNGSIKSDFTNENQKYHNIALDYVNVDANFYVEKASDIYKVLYDSTSIPFTTKKSGNYYKISFDMTLGQNHYMIVLNDTHFMNKKLTEASSIEFIVSENKYYTNKKLSSGSKECFTYSKYTLPKEPLIIITGYDMACGYDAIIPEKIDNLKVFNISKEAFYGCGLNSVIIPSNIEYIEESAFAYNNITEIKFNEGLLSLGKYSFYKNKLTNLVLPNSLNSLDKYVFDGNKLERVEFLGKSGEEYFADTDNPDIYSAFDWKDNKVNVIWH